MWPTIWILAKAPFAMWQGKKLHCEQRFFCYSSSLWTLFRLVVRRTFINMNKLRVGSHGIFIVLSTKHGCRKKLLNMTRYVRRRTPAPKMKRFYIIDIGSTPPGQVNKPFAIQCFKSNFFIVFVFSMKTFSFCLNEAACVSLCRFFHSRGRAKEHELCPHRTG